MDSSAIDFNFDDWRITPQERTRDRMKLQVKLSKIEAQAFKNFMETVKPGEVSENDFMKAIFRRWSVSWLRPLKSTSRSIVRN